MNNLDNIIDVDYLSNTELILLIEELKLQYTRQGINVMMRLGSKENKKIFSYDAIAFGAKLYRKEKIFDIINYIAKRRDKKISDKRIEKAIEKVKSKNRKQLT
jgi:Icc-related predicted phosphoesterase